MLLCCCAISSTSFNTNVCVCMCACMNRKQIGSHNNTIIIAFLLIIIRLHGKFHCICHFRNQNLIIDRAFDRCLATKVTAPYRLRTHLFDQLVLFLVPFSWRIFFRSISFCFIAMGHNELRFRTTCKYFDNQWTTLLWGNLTRNTLSTKLLIVRMLPQNLNADYGEGAESVP